MLRDELYQEIHDSKQYIQKMLNWITSDQYLLKEFNTNLHDIEVSDNHIYIYSCLSDDLIPDILSIDEFIDLLTKWLAQ